MSLYPNSGFSIKRGLLVLCLALLSTMGCATRPWMCGAGAYDDKVPLVTLESVMETKDSESRGYPILAIPMPYYPVNMRRAGIPGEVTARLSIGPDGFVQQSTILQSSQREFEDCVRFATSHWQFRPMPDTSFEPGQTLILDCRIKFNLAEEL